MSARYLGLLLSVAVAATLACSKTQDQAPERRIFGEPPTILSVDANFGQSEAHTECDFTDVVEALFCQNGVLDLEPQTGTGWWREPDPNDPSNLLVRHAATPTSVPGVIIDGTYTEMNFTVGVVDPNSTPGNTNILLVSSSFVSPESKTETSLVLFDDGSETNFPVEQKALVPESCIVDIPNSTCVCDNARYDIQSGDQTKNDGVYTRRFVVTNRNSSDFLSDCIMRSRGAIGLPASAGSTYEFKIEAVDRQGNLTVWPNTLSVETGVSKLGCLGDSCGCCMLHVFSQQASICECKGEDGLLSPSQFPGGFCRDGLNSTCP